MTSVMNDKLKYFVASVVDFPEEGGVAAKVGDRQIAIFNFKSRNEWYACDNACPHTGDMVLARGILGESGEEPKIVCPMHKRNFSLKSGECLNDENYRVNTYPVIVENDKVYLELESNVFGSDV